MMTDFFSHPLQTILSRFTLIFLAIVCLLNLPGCVSLPLISYNFPEKQSPQKTINPIFTPKTHPITQSSPTFNPPQSLNTNNSPPHKSIVRPNHSIIWQEMQHNFHLAIQNLGHYPSYIEDLSNKPSYFKIVSQRAKPYLHYILDQVKHRNMPYEIALLPMIESGFRPNVQSHKKANGLWQFIPSTARSYGLKQNWWYDGRQDIIQSTQAALNYLQDLYRSNQNDWLLALASYNAGPGTVRKAIRLYLKQQASSTQYSSTTLPSFWDIRPFLPKETQDYVPQLLAVSHIINHSDNFNIDLEPIENKAFFKKINLSKQIHLHTAQTLSNTPEPLFKQLNSGYLTSITPPQGPYHLLLPIDQAHTFQEQLASASNLFNIQWKQHTIRQGESLGLIAQNYQTSLTDIQTLNDLTSHHIQAGKTLLIPIPVTKNSPITSKKVAQTKDSNHRHQKITITLKKGHSLWKVAQQHRVTVKDLTRWNNLAPTDILQPGQTLTIWKPHSKTKTYNHYKIKTGDSLWKIAQKNRISTQLLAQYNNLSPKTYLKPGQILKIPKS